MHSDRGDTTNHLEKLDSSMTVRWSSLLIATLLAAPSSLAFGAPLDSVRDLASRIGPIVGSASACRDIARPRLQVIIEKFQTVIREVSAINADRDELTRLLDRYVADGRSALTSGRTDCRAAERQLADLEQSIAGTSQTATLLPEVTFAPPTAMAATTPAQVLPSAMNVHGVTQSEIRFGTVIPFSGPGKETGRLMKLGIEAAFNRANESGGINGRMLKLVAADDGYDPNRTVDAMKQLYDKDQVFGFIGSSGTANAAMAIPYALERRALFFAPNTGAGVSRRDPPDRYVFNYRPSYAEETQTIVNYLIKLRRLQPKQIAVFAQNDAFGDAGFAGVAKTFRSLGINDSAILRVGYERNTIDVDEAVKTLKAQKVPVRAVVMVATTRAAAKFIEKTHEQLPNLILANISVVGGSVLANELMLLGPRYANGVIVTQVVPGVSGYSSAVLEYKSALAKYFAGEAPSYTSLEGYIAASILIQALKRVGPQFDTEKLVDTLENIQNFDLGLGTQLGYGRAEHQASHKIWGTALDETGTFQPIELE
jgi:ABC-type branched-subunit amino acid transport system substrate-binding protein